MTSISRTEEENGNPLQCSCLENPRDGEPGGLLSMGLHRVVHNGSDLATVPHGGYSASRQVLNSTYSGTGVALVVSGCRALTIQTEGLS